jgi:hypothetical protein
VDAAGVGLGRLQVELAGEGGALGLGPDLGQSGLIWVGQALLLLVSGASVEAHPLAMVWLGRRIRAGVPRSGSRRRPLLGSVGLTCGCVLLVVPHCPSPGLLALFSPAILLDGSSWCFAVTWV